MSIDHEPAEAGPPALGDRIGSGRTAEVFAVGSDEVLKVLRPGMPGLLADREAEVAALVDAAAISAPGFRGIARIDGRPALRYERLSGISMLDQMSRRPLGIDGLAGRFAELHAVMHDRDGAGLPDQKGELRRMIARAGERLSGPARDAAIASMESLPSGTSICHGDMHPGNVMLSARGPVVIDWMTATCGSPAADVARTLFLVRDSGVPSYLSPAQRLLVTLARRRFASVYLRQYVDRRRLDPDELRAWRLPVVAARLSEGIDEETPRLTALLERLWKDQGPARSR